MTANPFGITIDCEYQGVDNRDGWEHHRYTVTLTRGGMFTRPGSMTTTYRAGMAHDAEPTVRDVLEALQSDARVDVYDEYDDIFDGMPYSKAREIAALTRAIVAQTRKLRRLLGDDFDAFVAYDFDDDDDDTNEGES